MEILDGFVQGNTGIQDFLCDDRTGKMDGLVESLRYVYEGGVQISNGVINISHSGVDKF